MIADAEKYRQEDELLAKKIHLRNSFEEAVYRIKSNLTDRLVKLSLTCKTFFSFFLHIF